MSLMKRINREYLRSVMFGIENSLISTVGLIAGISIGSEDKHLVILGATVAIVIEAVAMGVGEYLSDDAVQELDKIKRHPDNSLLSGFLMMLAGSLAGLVPLAPVIFLDRPASLITSVALALLILFSLGYAKGMVLGSNRSRSGMKILIVGGLAVMIGAVVGFFFKV
jgi:VIT1/CCC1 family predicted Fe2+/Mn2+ transporter